MQNLVTIKIFSYQSDLHLAKSFLESEGIECFVKDELVSQVCPLGANALGGFILKVDEQDVGKAIQLLIEGGFSKKEDFEPSESMKQVVKFIDWLKNLFSKE